MDDGEGFDEVMDMIIIVVGSRYLGERKYMNLRKHLRSGKCMEAMMAQYKHDAFVGTARMQKTSFKKLVDLISDDDVFKTNDRNPHSRHRQAPVWMQLMVVLQRLGCDGNGVSVERIAANGGFSVGSVHKFTERVYTAIRRLRRRVIAWPDADERKRISQRMDLKFGFPGAVGMLDGTPAVFCQKPGKDGEVFWTRKHHYAYNLQLSCDDRKLIRWYNIGWPGSVYDSTVFDSTELRKHPERFFSPGEYLMADAGYVALKFVCVPYKQPYASEPNHWCFNKRFSKARVAIEHVNGILKARWQSLKGIRVQVKTKRDFRRVCEHVKVCLILYNLMIHFNDKWEEDVMIDDPLVGSVEHLLADYDSDNDDEDEVDGKELRNRIEGYVLAWYHARRNRRQN